MSGETDRRLEAAERTVEVLKKKVIELYNGGQSAIGRQLEAARRREEENRRKREVMEARAAELEKYSRTLEDEVARRTKAIKTIVDNVTFGFLVVGRDLVVQPECTRSCKRLFGVPTVEGRPLGELLGMSPRQREEFALAADQVFEDILPEEVSLGQLRAKFPTARGSVLCAEGSVIRDGAGNVEALLFTISDITALEAATRESHVNRVLVGILRQKEPFQGFLAETRQQLAAARESASIDDQVFVRRVVHTIKGNCASYGLSELVEQIHAIEEAPEIRSADLDAIERSLRAFLEQSRAVLEIDYDRIADQAFFISRDQLDELRTMIERSPAGVPAELRAWTARIREKAAGQLLGPLEDFAARLAERLGKRATFVVTGDQVLVDAELMRPVLQSLPHLVRNALDHGIEPPGTRDGKPRDGRVEVVIASDAQGYRVVVSDDGRGIDLPTLRRRAVEKGMMTAEVVAALPDDGIDLIYLDGLSAAEVTTSISGRGVGMSAVRAAAHAAGGTLSVETAPGRGTTFTIRVPGHPVDPGSVNGPSPGGSR